MEKGNDPIQAAMDALYAVDPHTVVEPGDIRMALEGAVDAGWRLVRTEDTGEPGRTAVYITEEWTP